MNALPPRKPPRDESGPGNRPGRITPVITLGNRVAWLSYSSFLCSLAALIPLADLLWPGWEIPSWALEVALIALLGLLGRLLSELQVLRSEATSDVLTGTLARRVLERDLPRMIQRGRPFGVLFIDVDGMKQINDQLGHNAGDALLRHVADRIALSVRPTDLVYRYGGDEFVVLLPGADARSTRAVESRIREALRGMVTTGSACFPDDGQDAYTILKAADASMYQTREAVRGTPHSRGPLD